MKLVISSEPAIEPITTTELKEFLRIDSQSLADDISELQSIAPGDQVIAANYTLIGTGVDVLGYRALVILDSGTNGTSGTSGTVDVKIQESDDNTTFTDVTSGAFTQVTTTNDNAIQEKEYTGIKQYIRVVATVATATCDFGVSVIRKAPTSSEDTLLGNFIKSARIRAEEICNRAFITQTWDYYLDKFPDKDYIQIPCAPLQSITHLKYTDSEEAEIQLSTDDYDVDTKSEPGRLILKYGESFPSDTLRPMNPIVIRFIAGYGTAISNIPETIRVWIRQASAFLWLNRDKDITNFPLGILYQYRILMNE